MEKTRIIDQLVGAAEEKDNKSLSKVERQQLSLKILLTLSLRNQWLLTTTRATGACSQDALEQQLRDIGLEQHKMEPNIFAGDELVAMLCQDCILIGGPELQQECFFCELSALASLEPPKKLAQNTPISFGNLMMEYQEASNSISLRVTESFLEQLLQRHDLEKIEPTTSLQQEELSQDAASEHIALEADAKELYKQTVGDLGFLALACRPDLSFEVELLTQSLTSPTTRQAMQLQKVLGYLSGTLHYSLSLHPPTTKRTQEEDKNLELLSFSASSWTGACQSVSTACLLLWGVPLITLCKTACAENQADAELNAVKLALQMASFTKSLLQQLALEQLAKSAMISLKTSSLHMELAKGKPLAMQLGLSRRNKHLQLDGQLSLSRVLPSKNLAQSLANNAPDETMLAKLRIDKEAAKTGALSTVFGEGLASLVSSSSLLVGMVAVKPSQMEKLSPCQLAFPKSVSFVRSCPESLTRNFADSFAMSLASLTWISLSFLCDSLTLYSKSLERCNWTLHSLSQKVDRLPSLTLHSLSLATGILQSLILYSWSFATASLILYRLSFEKDRLQRLTLQSLSLRKAHGFKPGSFKEESFDEGTGELNKNLAHSKLDRRAGTNSFSKISLEQRSLAQEADKNSFEDSLTKMSLSLRMCLRIFLLGSFQLVCAALLVETSSFKISFSDRSFQQDQLVATYPSSFNRTSLQPEELAAAYFKTSFQQHSFQQDSFDKDELAAACLLSPTRAMQLESLHQKKLCNKSFQQLDLQISLSLSLSSFHSCSNTSFEQRALHCAALLFRNRFSRNQLTKQQLTGQQLTVQQLCLGFVSGGASEKRASTSPLQLTAWTWISLSLAFRAWLKSTSQRACRRRLAKSKCTASLSTTASASECPTLAQRTTRSLKATSFRRIASTRASSTSAFPTTSSLRTTSFSRSASMRALQSTSFRATLLWISFCFNHFFFINSFVACPLGLFHGHLGQANLSLDHLQDHSFIQKNKKKEQQLSEAVPDRELAQLQLDNLDKNKNNQLQTDQLQEEQVPHRELLQLHLSQLCQQDPDSELSRQLPEEPLSASGLKTAAWPAAVQSDQLSFSKQNLSEQDLSNISLEEFFPENFGKQLSDKQLQRNLSTDQRQLQNNQLAQNNFQQLSLEQPSFPEKILNKELATNLAKTSLIDNLVFQNFFFATLALQKVASEQLGENNLYKKQLATEQLDPERRRSLQRTASQNWLFQKPAWTSSFSATAWFSRVGPKQLHDKNFFTESFYQNSLQTRTLTRRPWQPACQQDLQQDSFRRTSLKKRTLQRLALRHFAPTAFQEQLAKKNFHQTSFFNSSFPAETSNRTAFQPAASNNRASEQKPFSQQLGDQDFQTGSFPDSSLTETTFSNSSLAETAFSTEASGRTNLDNNSFKENSFDNTSLEPERRALQRRALQKSFAEKSFAEKSFDREELDREEL